jgi:hypothetical protein
MTTTELAVDGIFTLLVVCYLVAEMAPLAMKILHVLKR